METVVPSAGQAAGSCSDARSATAEELRQRLAVACEHAQAMVVQASVDAAAARLLEVAQRASTAPSRVLWLHRAADAWAKPLAALSACRPGCSHCCYIPVAMTDVEARLLGERVGRKPAQMDKALRAEAALADRLGPVRLPGAPAKNAGYSDPCPFLSHGRCSIYEHRPLACRVHLNMDVDDYLCALRDDGVEVDVPYADATTLKVAHFLVQPTAKWADIRYFFPAPSDALKP